MPEHIKVKRIFLSKKKGVKNQPRCEITEGSLIINRLGAGHNGGVIFAGLGRAINT